MSGEGSADGNLAAPGGLETVDVSESACSIDTQPDSSAGECVYLAGLEDVMAAAVQEAEGDPKTLEEA